MELRSMTFGALWAISAAGCFAPHVESGVVCDPVSPVCPVGQHCAMFSGTYECSTEDGDGEPGPDAATAHDVDGDGIPDSVDLCPTTYDPYQDNEDGDRFGDACDPCPPIADDHPPDSDGDGVADACDPAPSTPGDHILRFDGFHRSPDPGWHSGGPWVIANDAATVNVGNGVEALMTMPSPTSARINVMTSFRVESLNGSIAYSGIGIVDQYDGTTGIACHALRNVGQDRLGLIDVSDGVALDSAVMSIAPGERYQARMSREGSHYDCWGVHGSASAQATTSYTVRPSAPEIGLGVHSAAVTFDWVLIVAGP